jgi:hypothetical protein
VCNEKGKVSAMFGLSSKLVNVKAASEVEEDEDVDFYIPSLYTWVSIAKGMKRKGYASNIVTEDKVTKVKKQEMRFKRKLLDHTKVMLLDTGFHIYLWYGCQADGAAQIAALGQVNEYLKENKRPLGMPVSMVKQNQKVNSFDVYFYDSEEKPKACVIC